MPTESLDQVEGLPFGVIFDILRKQATGAKGEIQLADAINVQAENNMFETLLLNGKRFDCGSIEGFVEAIKNVALTHNFN